MNNIAHTTRADIAGRGPEWRRNPTTRETGRGLNFLEPPFPLRATTEEADFYDRATSLDLSERAETDGRAE